MGVFSRRGRGRRVGVHRLMPIRVLIVQTK
ncbi:putative protein phosphatase 2C 26 [Iris pallida]|uniref:Uncharacterized protein n=1 Tax=Iris pallida TaxID=29817 RepID=A0AAX6EI21_IRIPA|nr:putative protein phosphatase 2C 26 [Iris pallida]